MAATNRGGGAPVIPGQLIPLAGHVSLLYSDNLGRYPHAHGLVIEDGQTVMVDAGAGEEILKPWAEPGRVDILLNTHTHGDHAAYNWVFEHSELGVPAQAWESAGDLVKLGERFAEPGPLAEAWRKRAVEFQGLRERRPDFYFEPGREMRAGKTRWEVIHAPGHTADHCCLHFPDLGLVLAADIDMTAFGPFYGHRESDLRQFRASIQAIKKLKPRILVSSHMPPLYNGIDQALDAYAAVMDRRGRQILELLRARPRTQDDLMDQAIVYGPQAARPPLLRYWEGQIIGKHLDELLGRGLIRLGPRGFEAA